MPPIAPWAQPWLWELRPDTGPGPDPAAPTVLFLPHAGGSASSFTGWAGALPGRVRTLAAQYPGRGSRFAEPAVTDMPGLVEPLATALAPLPGPLVLVGHSLGALVGFELAWRLQQAGRAPAGLLASAARAPGLPTLFRHLPAVPPDPQLVDLLHRTGGLPALVLADPDLLDLVLGPLRSDLELVESYRDVPAERRLHCPITAAGGRDDLLVPPDMLERWQDRGTAGVTVHLFDGGHFYFTDHLDRAAELAVELLG